MRVTKKILEITGWELIPDCKKKFHKLWCVRFNILAGVLSFIEVVLPLVVDDSKRGWFAAAAGVAVICGTISRAIQQKKLNGNA